MSDEHATFGPLSLWLETGVLATAHHCVDGWHAIIMVDTDEVRGGPNDGAPTYDARFLPISAFTTDEEAVAGAREWWDEIGREQGRKR